jgi:hypothetical protein
VGGGVNIPAGKLQVVVEQPIAYLQEGERWKARLA